MSNLNTINEIAILRDNLSSHINRLKELEKESAPPVVQELVLARRAAEDYRMRLGVATAYLKGQDPFRDRQAEIAAEEE